MKTLAFTLTTVLMTGLSQAQSTVWNPVANGVTPPDTGDFLETLNWTNGIMTDLQLKAVLNVPGAATCTLSGEIGLRHVVCGDNSPGGMLILADGANLTTQDWTAAGFNESGTIIVETGATANFLSHLWVAHKNDEGKDYESSFIIDGGTVTVSGAMTTGFSLEDQPVGGSAKGFIELKAGSLHNDGDFFFDELDLYGSFDIEEGVWTLSGDRADRVNESVASGTITAYGGEGTVNVTFDDNSSLTTITATPPPSNTPFVIHSYTLDEGSGAMELVWGSVEGTDYRIVYGTDLSTIETELEEQYPADGGSDTTTYPFSRALLFPADAERVYFRVEKFLPAN